MKRVLFVCMGNSCRSQMAKGFFNNYSKHAIADSAGTKPEDKIDSVAIQVMKEKNIDISDFVPKMFTFFMNNEFEYIVTMGCIDVCTISPKDKIIEWSIEDPKGKSIDFYRRIRDQIENNVKKLINEVI
jgi:arsenate reductase